MLYAVVYKLNIDTSKLDSFKKKYDPYAELIGAHITLVFPTPDSIKVNDLERHLQKILKNWKPFEIHIAGLSKSWDHWLNLDIKEGHDKIIRLHDELYTGILKPFLRKDIPFIPHIGLGLFVDKSKYDVSNPKELPLDEKRYQIALKEAEESNFDYQTILDRVELVSLNGNLTKILKSQVFNLL